MIFENLDEVLGYMKEISKTKNLYIWGIGIYGNSLGKLFNKNNISWLGYYDNFNNVDEGNLNFKPVYQGSQIDIFENAVYILAMRFYQDVKMQLIEAGVSDKNILYFDDVNILNSIGNSVEYLPSTDKLKSLYNIHKEERCFIVGNGPSLSIEDLEVLYEAGVISFASNLIFKCYDKTNWRPNYYFITDENGIRKTFKNNEVLNYVSQNCEYLFSRNNGGLAKYNDYISNLLLFRSVYSISEEKFEFSSDCSDKVFIGYTITYAMIQIAVYMGFREIYLLGMDHNFSLQKMEDGSIIKNDGVDDHSKILGNYNMWAIPDINRTIRVYESAKNYADSHNIKIYNATRGGKLEVFERVNFDELFYRYS